MIQLALDFRPRVVTLRCRAVDRFDARTGQPFAWCYGLDEPAARAMLARIQAGTQVDPFGRPWGAVEAWIE